MSMCLRFHYWKTGDEDWTEDDFCLIFPFQLQSEFDDEVEDAEIMQATAGFQEDAGSIRSMKSDGSDLIHPNDVYKALRDFVNEHRKPTK